MNRLFKFLFAVLGLGADVITTTIGTAGQAGSTAAELITYMSAKLLEVAELITLLDQFGDKQPIPSNSSKTIRFVRLEKLSVPTTPTQLTEGIPPDAEPLTFNQWKKYFKLIFKFGYLLETPKTERSLSWNNPLDWTISRKDAKLQFV